MMSFLVAPSCAASKTAGRPFAETFVELARRNLPDRIALVSAVV
jgi:hypothetical protein